MHQNLPKLCAVLATALATGFFGRVMILAEEVNRADIPDDQMGAYVDELAQARRIVTELKINMIGGKPTYNVKSVDNSQHKPWIIEFNISDAAFETSSKKYERDGFEMTIHETTKINRKQRHSAVWVQDPKAGPKLTLPEADTPESGEIGRNLQPLNELMRRTLKEHNIPGATLAVGVVAIDCANGWFRLLW